MKLYFFRSDGQNPDNPLDLFIRAPSERVALVRWLTYWQRQGRLTAAQLTPNYDLYAVPEGGVDIIPWGAFEQGGVELISSSYLPELDCAIVGPTKFNRAERALIRSLVAMHAEIREGEDPAKVANNVLRILSGNSRVDLVTGRPERPTVDPQCAANCPDIEQREICPRSCANSRLDRPSDEARTLQAIRTLIDSVADCTVTDAIIADAEAAYSSLEVVLDDGSGTLQLTTQPEVVQGRIAAAIQDLRTRAKILRGMPALTDADQAELALIDAGLDRLESQNQPPPLTKEQADAMSKRAT